jgi:V8-like Glu-specific endopeptidase
MLFDSSAPFGEAWGMRVYYKRKISDETLGWIDEQFDYVVVVLDRRIGDTTGWMGSRGYTDDWDHGTYWSHVGYPGDIGAALRPTFQTDIALDGIWYELDSHEAMSHSADVWPGQSGGPFFGWWAGENWPSVVAVQSTQNSSENKASGGQDLVDLIIKATNDFP